MNWLDEQVQAENIEEYQNYKITEELRGRMTPTEEEVIRLLNSKRVVQL